MHGVFSALPDFLLQCHGTAASTDLCPANYRFVCPFEAPRVSSSLKAEARFRIFCAVKYQNAQALALRLGQLLGRQLQGGAEHLPDVLVPVPLHPKKKKTRGYNQSELLARGISSATGIPVDAELLIRNRHTPSQTGMDRTERWQNTSGAFECSGPIKAGTQIALVDDMITTGAHLRSLLLGHGNP